MPPFTHRENRAAHRADYRFVANMDNSSSRTVTLKTVNYTGSFHVPISATDPEELLA
jgi:hypothetical protein